LDGLEAAYYYLVNNDGDTKLSVRHSRTDDNWLTNLGGKSFDIIDKTKGGSGYGISYGTYEEFRLAATALEEGSVTFDELHTEKSEAFTQKLLGIAAEDLLDGSSGHGGGGISTMSRKKPNAAEKLIIKKAQEGLVTAAEQIDINAYLKKRRSKVHGNNIESPQKSGNYRIVDENGKPYNGKGLMPRMFQSIKEKSKEYGVSFNTWFWESAETVKEALKKEKINIKKDGGKDGDNYNKTGGNGD
jgi:hypothetical protein